ncbi:MAG: hypothetical protein WBG23_08050 [Acidobacteriaceae bacterium]|jgi:hypothetical protein
MGLDIRLPLGLLFVVTGGMMTVYGLFTHGSAIYEKSLGIDINLVWGVVLAMFGTAMLLLAYLNRRRMANAPPVNSPSEAPAPPRPHGH